MKLSELIRKKEIATVTVATHATNTPLYPPSVATVASVNVATETDSKPVTLLDRQREARRQKVIAMLDAAPDTQRAIYADTDSDPHNVILAIAVRHIATCDMLILKEKYDAFRLLELIERMGVQNVH
jgi:hypothetical protein